MTSKTLAALAADLAHKRTTSRALTEASLAAIRAPDGEGRRAFIAVDEAGALAEADAMDRLRDAGVWLSPYAGIPISIKDLFDIAGQVTRAGSTALADRPPAPRDAEAVARLRRAGFVLVGRANMSEFAFSGVGINPHYGTPLNIWDRASRRVPGGSSSGGAIAVAEGMVHATLGTDTGGSCRIPAALNGLVGFKPTARRVPLTGAVPLSTTLDSAGPIARSVACCAAMDALLAGEPAAKLGAASLQGLRFAVPNNYVTADMDRTVAAAFDRALTRLSRAGALVRHIDMPELDTIARINALGGFSAAESYAWHRDLLARKGALYDPRVKLRIERGAGQTAADYIDLGRARGSFVAALESRLGGFDALLMPTVPVVAPRLSELDADADFTRINLLLLRNPSVVNMLDGCAISIPVQEKGTAPVGLSLCAPGGRDAEVLRMAAAAEALFARG